MLTSTHHRINNHAKRLSLSDFEAFHYSPNANVAKQNTNHAATSVPQMPKNQKKVDAKWKERQVIDIAIELHQLFEPSIENEYNDVNSTKNKSMSRINMSHRIAVAINNDTSSKKSLSTMGLSKDSTHDDCIHGMNITPSTLLHYCHVMKWDVLHVRGCVYYHTGRQNESDNDENEGVDANNADGNASECRSASGIHIIHYDSNMLLCHADPTDIYNKYIPLTNIRKPLQSIHTYKLSDLNALKTKLNAWRLNNRQQDLPDCTLKKEVYSTLSDNIPHF